MPERHTDKDDLAILRALDEYQGAYAGTLALRMVTKSGYEQRAANALARQKLFSLEVMGLACPMDDRLPARWRRTAAGSAALARAAKILGAHSRSGSYGEAKL